MRNFFTVALAFALGCGSVTNPGEDLPDAGSEDDGGDPGPLTVASTVPAQDATGVSVILPAIEFEMSHALDPSSVSADRVTVVDHRDRPVAGVVDYDEARNTVMFTPAIPLVRNTTYTATLAPVRDPGGDTSDPFELTFKAFVNPESEITVYDDGAIVRIITFVLDDDGRRVAALYHEEPGSDGTWGTGDDVLTSRTNYEYDGTRLVSYSRYGGPGLDGVWGTPDDEIIGHYSYGHDAEGRLLRYSSATGAGADGVWGNADDERSFTNLYTPAGDTFDHETVTQFDAPGADGLWETADDVVEYRDVYTWLGPGVREGVTRYAASGVDGVWGTADDEIRYYATSTVDARGFVVQEVYYLHVGDDGVWHTADDGPSNYVIYDLHDDGRRRAVTNFNGPGPDGVWLNDDDRVSGHTEYDYDANLQLARSRTIDAGEDFMLGTADDALRLYYDYSYDEDGAQTTYFLADGPGADGTWFTDDDVLASEYVFETSL